MKRSLALSTLLLPALLLAACSALAPKQTQATDFQNVATGEIVPGCGSMQGFKAAVDEAQDGCIDAWKAKGWSPVNGTAGTAGDASQR